MVSQHNNYKNHVHVDSMYMYSENGVRKDILEEENGLYKLQEVTNSAPPFSRFKATKHCLSEEGHWGIPKFTNCYNHLGPSLGSQGLGIPHVHTTVLVHVLYLYKQALLPLALFV